MCTLYAFKCVMVMCAWIWLVYWHFAAILVSLRDNKVESEFESESELLIKHNQDS